MNFQFTWNLIPGAAAWKRTCQINTLSLNTPSPYRASSPIYWSIKAKTTLITVLPRATITFALHCISFLLSSFSVTTRFDFFQNLPFLLLFVFWRFILTLFQIKMIDIIHLIITVLHQFFYIFMFYI